MTNKTKEIKCTVELPSTSACANLKLTSSKMTDKVHICYKSLQHQLCSQRRKALQ